MVRCKVKDNLLGMMVKYIQEDLKMENSTEWVKFIILMDKKLKDNGFKDIISNFNK